MNNHTFLVIGLGSMGKRRIRNLFAIGYTSNNIIGVDAREDRRVDSADIFGIKTYPKIDENTINFADIFVISTPPDSHIEYASIGVDNGKHIFIEASVLIDGLHEISIKANLKKLVAFPSYTMRFFEGPKKIKKIICDGVIGVPLVWQYQSGQYLPDWHPWEDARDYYVSNPITGGCREIVPFELQWIEDIFGRIEQVDCRAEKVSDMPILIQDIYLMQMKHEGGVLGQLIVDVLGRAPIRYMRVTATKGTLEWSDSENVLRIYDVSVGTWSVTKLGVKKLEGNYINPEKPYQDEIICFLNLVNGGLQPDYTITKDLETLGTLRAAESSSLNERREYISVKVHNEK